MTWMRQVYPHLQWTIIKLAFLTCIVVTVECSLRSNQYVSVIWSTEDYSVGLWLWDICLIGEILDLILVLMNFCDFLEFK